MAKIKLAGASFLVILLLIMLMSCAHTCAQQADGPFLAFEEESFDFGKIEEGTVAAHVFKFQNCGSDTLHIQRVRAT
jgi:hypothetical protein